LEYNKNKSKEDKINTKIGISVGRCLDIDNLGNNKNDLMGIAVDTASRIQALAKPGQILIDYELKLRIKNLAVNKKKKQNAKEACFSFGTMKLRNLRGIGPVKIAEVRWNKLLDIKREEDDFTKEQLKELATILSKNNEHMILDSSTFCKPLLSDEEKQVAVRNGFQNSKNIIRILAYSLSSWKERIEKPLLDAIKRGVKIEILVLSSTSKYRFEKTLYESFDAEVDLKNWVKKVQKIKKSYQTNLQNTLDTIKIWQSQLDKSHAGLLSLRSYDEMPNYYGFMFDEDSLYFSSFYVDLSERGYNLPAVLLQKNTDRLGDIIMQGFQNWFDIKFALNEQIENY
jgi:hypothetical protein